MPTSLRQRLFPSRTAQVRRFKAGMKPERQIRYYFGMTVSLCTTMGDIFGISRNKLSLTINIAGMAKHVLGAIVVSLWNDEEEAGLARR